MLVATPLKTGIQTLILLTIVVLVLKKLNPIPKSFGYL